VSSDKDSGSLQELHDRIVSSFNSAEKRTAEVRPEDLQCVFDALTPALPVIFRDGSVGVNTINTSYPDNPLFRAFALARAACGMRPDLNKSNFLLDQAKKLVPTPGPVVAKSLAERSVLSYIVRNVGVSAAMEKKWEKAAVQFEKAIELLPTNATAIYLSGMAFQEQEDFKKAAECHIRSIALDPDFRSPFMAFGTCSCHLGNYQDAIDASLGCLARQPDAPVAQYTMGQAIYQWLHEWKGREQEAIQLRAKGNVALKVAKEGMPGMWTQADEQMWRYFTVSPAQRAHMKRQEMSRAWKQYGWRP